MPLDTAPEVEVDTEDGTGGRLGASVYFTMTDLPDSPRVTVDHHSRPVTLETFVASAVDVC